MKEQVQAFIDFTKKYYDFKEVIPEDYFVLDVDSEINTSTRYSDIPATDADLILDVDSEINTSTVYSDNTTPVEVVEFEKVENEYSVRYIMQDDDIANVYITKNDTVLNYLRIDLTNEDALDQIKRVLHNYKTIADAAESILVKGKKFEGLAYDIFEDYNQDYVQHLKISYFKHHYPIDTAYYSLHTKDI